VKILVTGATGNVGRYVVDELLARGATDVRALTNNPAKAALPDGVEVVEGYLGKLSSMPAALEGVDKLYLAPLPRTAPQVLELAKAAGVQHVVDLSSSNADDEKAGDPAGWHYYAVEKATEDSGLPWTHLRPGEFMINSTTWIGMLRANGKIQCAYPSYASGMIALEDIAAVAAEILLGDSDRHIGKKYLLTGPEPLPVSQVVSTIGELLGREIPIEPCDHDEMVRILAELGMGEFAAWYVDGMAQLSNTPMPVSPVYRELTGQPGTAFAEWIVKHRSDFV
jgi:uncharacterized protein YbjT (DUF2867 family)